MALSDHIFSRASYFGVATLPLALLATFGGVAWKAHTRGPIPSRGTVDSIVSSYAIPRETAALIASVAASIGASALDLAALINFESNGTFSTSVRNQYSGATGWIQFMPSTARKLGTTTDALAAMTPRRHADYVRQYFERIKTGGWQGTAPGSLSSLQSLAMSVFYPAYRTVPLDTAFPSSVQRANPGIHTVRDYLNKMKQYRGARKNGR